MRKPRNTKPPHGSMRESQLLDLLCVQNRYHRVVAGKMVEVDVVTARAEDWDASPESRDHSWLPLRRGGFVQAVRLTS